MCYLVSQKTKYFQAPQSVTVADREFEDVHTATTRHLWDNDGKFRSFWELSKTDSKISAYVEDHKVVRYKEFYEWPKTIELGSSVYDNVVSKLTIPNQYDMYTVMRPSGYINHVKVGENGEVTDINRLKVNILKQNLTKPIKSLAKFIKTVIL